MSITGDDIEAKAGRWTFAEKLQKVLITILKNRTWI